MFKLLNQVLKRRKFLTTASQGLVAATVISGIEIASAQPETLNISQMNQKRISVFRHVIMFKLKPSVSAAQRDQWLEKGRQLPNQIKVIRAFSIGTDVLHQPRSYDVAIIADFDNIDDYHTYEAHPAHKDFHQGSNNLSQQIISVDFQV